MKTFSIISIWLLFIIPLRAIMRNQSDWIDIGRSLITFSTSEKNWTDAKRFCENINSRLLIVPDKETYNKLYELFETKVKTKPGMWSGHPASSKDSSCTLPKAESITPHFNHNNASFYAIVYLTNKGDQLFCGFKDINESRYYICQIDKNISVQHTTKSSNNHEPTGTSKSDESNDNTVDTIIILSVSMCAAIAIVASALGALCFYKVRGLKKKSEKQSALPRLQNNTENLEDIGDYAIIKETETTSISHTNKMYAEKPLNNSISTTKSGKSDLEPSTSDQQSQLQNDGRYVTEEGLVYVTVSHVKTSPKPNEVEKPEVNQDAVEYATVSKQSRHG